MTEITNPYNVLKFIKDSNEADVLIKSLAEYIVEYDINLADFYDVLQNRVAFLSYKKHKNKKSHVMAATGIKRDVLRNILKNKKVSANNTIRNNILFSVIEEINKYCKDNNCKKMPKIIFYDRMKQYKDGQSSVLSYINIFEETGIIGQDEDSIFVNLEKSIKKRPISDYKKHISLIFEKGLQTINYNKNIDEDKGEETYFHMLSYSTQIPPENLKLAISAFNDKLRKFNSCIINLLEDYEIDVPPGTFAPVGTLLLLYNDQPMRE